jgi:O-antigen/teichoic acid export membrane protein
MRNLRLTVNEVLRQLVLVACFVVLVIMGAGLLPFFAAQLVTALVILGFTPVLLHRRHLVRPRWTRSELRSLLVMTLPLAVSAVLTVLYFRILVILMSLLAGSATEVGFYVTSSRIVEIFLGLPVILVGVVLPVLSLAARNDEGRLFYVTQRMTQALALLGILLALGLGTGARPIVLLLGGDQYSGAVAVLQIQSVALVTIFVTGAWTTTLVSMTRTRELAICTGIGVLAVVALGAILIPPFGARGGAIAAVLADLAFCAAIYAALRRAGPGREFDIAPFARIAAAAIGPVLVAVASPLPATLNAVIVVLLFASLAAAFGAVPSELIDRLRRRPAKRTSPQ